MIVIVIVMLVTLVILTVIIVTKVIVTVVILTVIIFIVSSISKYSIIVGSRVIIPFMIPLDTAVSYVTLNLKFFKKHKS